MPIYDFKCKSCDHQFEEFYHMSEEINPICPKCGQQNSTKLMSLMSDWIAPHPALWTGRYPKSPGEKKEEWVSGKRKKYY